MIEFDTFAVAAPRYVYGHWFVSCLDAAGIRRIRGNAGELHLPPMGNRSLLVLSITRHPLGWLYAFYNQFKRDEGCPNFPGVQQLQVCARNSRGLFENFVESYLKSESGLVSSIFDRYQASMCMRCEDFPWAVCEFLESRGIRNIKSFEDAVFPKNECPWLEDTDRSLRRDVVRAESALCRRMEYY